MTIPTASDIFTILLENKVYFYFSNKVVGKAEFIFHGENIKKAQKLFPELVEIIPHYRDASNFAIGKINDVLEVTTK